MNEDIFKGYWHEIKGKLRNQWGKITDDEVAQMKGSYEELHGSLQKNYGYQKEQAEKEIKDFFDKNNWKNK
ncbi:MAG: CsbD family protein [Alphaproteobacteria bacterium]|nr:CsbD family protein [Alphaproteobacteria bacterium]